MRKLDTAKFIISEPEQEGKVNCNKPWTFDRASTRLSYYDTNKDYVTCFFAKCPYHVHAIRHPKAILAQMPDKACRVQGYAT